MGRASPSGAPGGLLDLMQDYVTPWRRGALEHSLLTGLETGKHQGKRAAQGPGLERGRLGRTGLHSSEQEDRDQPHPPEKLEEKTRASRPHISLTLMLGGFFLKNTVLLSLNWAGESHKTGNKGLQCFCCPHVSSG